MNTIEYGKYLGYEIHIVRNQQKDEEIDNSSFLSTFIKLKLKELETITSNYARDKHSITKVRRNRGLVKVLKELYGGQCQLCGNNSMIPTILNKEGGPYVEVHHINEISTAKSEDDIEQIDSYHNAIVVCPFHHALLHHHHGGGFRLSDNKESLINTEGDQTNIMTDYHLKR